MRSGARSFASGWPPLVLALLLCPAPGCSTLGRAALGNGRGAYNAVINQTEDEQILSMIVRQRYDETYGLLSVASVTANLKIGASLGANVGIGSDEGYAGNLVPFSAGATYEENPTISYVPIRGEQFVERMLGPISADHVLLLTRMSSDVIEVMRMLVRRINGLANPVYAPSADAAAFDQFIEVYARLRDEGVLDVVQSGDGYELLLHDQSPQQAADATALLQGLGIARAAPSRRELSLPLRFFVGTTRGDGLDLETPSALEVIEAAGLGVQVPEAHLSKGIARRASLAEARHFLTVHASRSRPKQAVVAVEHRGFWFFIDQRDARSKQGFQILRTLIGMRLDDSYGAQATPVLTVPVGN